MKEATTVSKGNVLLVSYHYFPDTAVGARRPAKFTETLVENGYVVDLLSVKRKSSKLDSNINNSYLVRELNDPINFIWSRIKKAKNYFKTHENPRQNYSHSIEKPEAASTNKYSRLERYLFSFQALLSANKSWVFLSILKIITLKIMGNRYSIILSSSPPSSVNLVALAAKLMFRAKWVCDLRDPIIQWDDVAPETISKPRVKIEELLEKYYLSFSDKIIVTTPSYKKRLNNKTSLIYNGSDTDIIAQSSSESTVTKVVYAGSLYMNRNPFVFLEAVEALIKSDSGYRVQVDFYGNCESWSGRSLQEWINSRGMESFITINGSVGSDELSSIYINADILLVFAQLQPTQIPAKIFEYLPYEGIILAVTEHDSDTGKIISDNNLGCVANGRDQIIGCLDAVINKRIVISNKSKNIFSRYNQNMKLMKLLDELQSV